MTVGLVLGGPIFAGVTPFGFEIPQGNPGAIEQAAACEEAAGALAGWCSRCSATTPAPTLQ